MADKEQIRDMLDSIIDGNDDKAQVDFHSFVTDKMKEIIQPEESDDVNAESDD